MSHKNTDNKNRVRSKTIAFRISPQEAEQLDSFVRISGLNKQDYLISRVLESE
ncbi:MAG: plasmid mobilization protein [Oscillospiraceae bacterium]